jgi:hypothetical protein
MSINQPLHLYTIWRYDHNPDTIEDHKEKIADFNKVKWLILYSDEDKQYFTKSLSKRKICAISDQAKKIETVLYAQCIQFFKEQIYAGKIEDIAWGLEKNINDDELVPDYYKKLLKNKKNKLNVLCSILLSKLVSIDSEEVFNLNVFKKDPIQTRYTYNLTQIVFQDHIHDIFSTNSKIVRDLTIVQRRKERTRAIAALLWEKNPNITIADMIQKDEITKFGCESKIYAEKTLRNWIKDLCPNRSPGRPRKK